MSPSEPAIAATDIHKCFGEVVALGGVDLVVEPGTVYGLLGPNGAGKTTMVRIFTTILRPTSGTASVLGLDVARQPDAVRASIGLAGQYAAVDENLTARENLRLVGRLTHQPKSTIRPRADELIERFDLTHAADRPLKTFSGGMRRRLDLAASLVHRPRVLFLDEPTTGLDPRSRQDLWGLIRELQADGTTLLLTTQYLEEADQLADRIAVIDRGLVIAEGTSSELKAQMGATVIEITLADEAMAEKAAATLSDGLPGAEAQGETVRATVDDGPARSVAVLRALDGAGIELAGLTLREPSLDDVFLSITGHPAEEDGDPSGDGDPAGDGEDRAGEDPRAAGTLSTDGHGSSPPEASDPEPATATPGGQR